MAEMVGNWMYDKGQQLGGETGGGVCYVACDVRPLRVLANSLPAAAITDGTALQRLATGLFELNRLGVRPQDAVAVIKFAKNPDERFRREIEKLARLTHPNLVRILDFDREKQAWYVMEILRRGDLTQAATRAEYRGQPRKVLQRALGVAEALAALHEVDIIHRDIKAKNVLVADDGRWVLTDLGVALDLNEQERLTVGPQPFSDKWRPDWVVEEKDQTARMDVQMLAMVIHFMILGSPTPAPASQIGRTRFDIRELFPQGSSEAAHELIRQNVSANAPDEVKCKNAAEFAKQIRHTLGALDGGRPERLLFSFAAEHTGGWVPTTSNRSHGFSRILVMLANSDDAVIVRARLEDFRSGVRIRALIHPERGAPVGASEQITLSDKDLQSNFNWSPPVRIITQHRWSGPHYIELEVEPHGPNAKEPSISGVMITSA